MGLKVRRSIVAIVLILGVLVPLWLWMSAPERPDGREAIVPVETPTRGAAAVAVDRSLIRIMEQQSRNFTDHYPDVRVTLSPEPSGRTLLRLFDREAGAAVVDGGLIREEDSVVASLKRPVRKEPIARNALVFIVNRSNPSKSVSIGELKGLFSGSLSSWQSLGGGSGRIIPLVDGSDFRSQAVLSESLFGKARKLSASALPDVSELITRVGGDPNACAVVSLPEYAAALRAGGGMRIKALPVSRTEDAAPVAATPENIYSGAYPLVSIIYYLYDPFNPAATGFGAWLSREGQTLFERGDMAPFRQTVRTIILK